MTDFPAGPGAIPVVLSSAHSQMAGGTSWISITAFGSATWPANNQAIFVPFFLNAPETIVKLFCMNGTVASGNIDMGIYSEDGTRIVSNGTVAQTGTSVVQEFNITDTQIGPGKFYLALALSSTVGTVFRVAGVALNQTGLLTGCAEMATAFVLPATATLATPANSYVPLMAMTTRTVV